MAADAAIDGGFMSERFGPASAHGGRQAFLPKPAGLSVRAWSAGNEAQWDAYVEAQPAATLFHRRAWSEAVVQAYGHRPLHLLAWEDARVRGLLPLMLVKSPLAGRVLVSVPYATYGGILADTPAGRDALFREARQLCDSLRCRYLELRHRDVSGLDLPEIGRYDTFRRELPAGPEDVLAGLPRKTRAAARKAMRELGQDAVRVGPEWLEPIYDLYACNLRRLGSPNHRRSLFRALQRTYGADCVCMAVLHRGKPVAGAVSFRFRDEMVPYFSGALPVAQSLCANNLLYLSLMEYAVRQGLRRFDFNRSRRENSGPHDFKRHHGFEPEPLHYQVHLSGGGELPNLSPDNRRYRLAGRLWRHLPLCFTRPAGAFVSKWIP